MFRVRHPLITNASKVRVPYSSVKPMTKHSVQMTFKCKATRKKVRAPGKLQLEFTARGSVKQRIQKCRKTTEL